MANKSQSYGYYGGVTQNNHYVPPPSIPFTPQPASVPFYTEQAISIMSLLSSIKQSEQFFENNEGNIMRRYMVFRTDDEEFYEINTITDPGDVIIYATTLSGSENLLLMDGGTF
jgi:hypothetical protein